jgi:hypothetical protein
MTAINSKIKYYLDKYLEFDSDELFRNADLMLIFGGCLRDIIANQKIHDIDILCGSKSCKQLHELLERNGFSYKENLTPKDLASVYTEIHIINEPHTFVKGDKVVQLIRPSIGYQDAEENYRGSLTNLVFEVDLSCCGLSYNGKTLIENVRNAVLHCCNKTFEVRKTKMNLPKRIQLRTFKLEERGWENIESTPALIRDDKIDAILNNNDGIDYSFACVYSPDDKLFRPQQVVSFVDLDYFDDDFYGIEL